MNTRKRLAKSRRNRIFGGIAGVLADYFEIDPVVVRILFIFSVLGGGTGLFIYIALLIVMPENLSDTHSQNHAYGRKEQYNRLHGQIRTEQ